jgi:hypothetical protein
VIDFPDASGDLPTVQPPLQVYVGDESLVALDAAPEQSKRFLSGRQDVCVKTAVD